MKSTLKARVTQLKNDSIWAQIDFFSKEKHADIAFQYLNVRLAWHYIGFLLQKKNYLAKGTIAATQPDLGLGC